MRPNPARHAAVVAAALWQCTAFGGVAYASQHQEPLVSPTRVLVLYSLAPEHPGISDFVRQLRVTLRSGLATPVEFYEEFLELTRVPGSDRPSQLARSYGEKYGALRFDLIIPVGSGALRLAMDQLAPVFPDIPVVFAMTLGLRTRLDSLPRHVTGRLTGTPFVPTLALARRLQPDAKRVVVIGGTTGADSAVVMSALAAVALHRDSLSVSVLQGQAFHELIDAVRNISPQTIAIFANFERDGRGQFFIPSEAAALLAASASVPLYGHVATGVGRGLVGGAVAHYGVEGTKTGQLALRVLQRAPGTAMPAVELPTHSIEVDWRQLRRWSLPEGRLPAGTVVHFRALSAWQRYQMPILLVLVLIGTQSLLIVRLLVERRRRIRSQHMVDEQLAFERLISGLTTDLVELADDVTCALERALARLAGYAGAASARLTIDVDGSDLRVIAWRSDATGADLPADVAAPAGTASLVLPLTATGNRVGTLELHAARTDQRWPSRVVLRLRSAVEVIAGAIAREAAARTARRNEVLNQAVLASISAQIAILDRRGDIVRVNEAWREHSGRGGADAWRNAVVGMNYLDECRRAHERGDVHSCEIRRGIEAVLARDAPSFRREYHDEVPEERWYELIVEPLDHSEGGAVVTHLDITDRRLAELTVEASHRQVAHMARVATVGELAATLIHELGQPLTAIANSAYAGTHMAAHQPPDLPELAAILGEITDDTARAVAVIDRVRSLLRKEDPRIEAVDLNAICWEVRALLEFDATRRRVRIELDLDPASPTVAGDAVQLKQVVLNLALNGLEAAAASDGRREVIVHTRRADETAEISVCDSGPGLSAEAAARAFQPFFSTKAHGLGMGLAIVKSIVDRHGGHVYVDAPTAGEYGAVFRVSIPLTTHVPQVGPRLAAGRRDRALQLSAL